MFFDQPVRQYPIKHWLFLRQVRLAILLFVLTCLRNCVRTYCSRFLDGFFAQSSDLMLNKASMPYFLVPCCSKPYKSPEVQTSHIVCMTHSCWRIMKAGQTRSICGSRIVHVWYLCERSRHPNVATAFVDNLQHVLSRA